MTTPTAHDVNVALSRALGLSLEGLRKVTITIEGSHSFPVVRAEYVQRAAEPFAESVQQFRLVPYPPKSHET